MAAARADCLLPPSPTSLSPAAWCTVGVDCCGCSSPRVSLQTRHAAQTPTSRAPHRTIGSTSLPPSPSIWPMRPQCARLHYRLVRSAGQCGRGRLSVHYRHAAPVRLQLLVLQRLHSRVHDDGVGRHSVLPVLLSVRQPVRQAQPHARHHQRAVHRCRPHIHYHQLAVRGARTTSNAARTIRVRLSRTDTRYDCTVPNTRV